ncbi:hypothetical protein FGIG_04490 [Fasciola gigantica]|uniref:Uncharacterized protein n=1 Tax=Fasciola gigantica TaxID=46835 RepID=A0A504Y8B7_FASGI|nr:hypothetical protein FGIG_04490 [Fasciola gigantica]
MEFSSFKAPRNARTVTDRVSRTKEGTIRISSNQTNVIYSGRLLIRFAGCAGHSDQLLTGIGGDQASYLGIYDQLKPYFVALYPNRMIQLELCPGERSKQPRISGPRDTHQSLPENGRNEWRYRIVGVKKKNPHTFYLDVINTKTQNEVHVEKLICHASQSKKSTEWVEIIRRIIKDTNHSAETSTKSMCLRIPIRLTVADRTENVDGDQDADSLNCCSFSMEPAHITISPKEVRFCQLANKESQIRLELDDVQIKRKDLQYSMAPNVFLLLSSKKEYTCQAPDRLQCLIASTMLELWIRLNRSNRTAGCQHEDSGKPIEGRLLIGSSLYSLNETQVCIYSQTKSLECLDMYGTFEKFEIFHSDLVHLDTPHFHACRVLARQILPEYEAGHIRELFIRVPTRHALLKWHQHFNLSPSTVLSLLNVILTELESRHHIPQGQVRLSQGDGIPVEQRLDPKEALQLFTLSANQLAAILKVRSDWPNNQVEQLLMLLLSSVAHPIIKNERQSDIANLMLPYGFNPMHITKCLPDRVAEMVSQMSVFNVCVLNRIALFFIVGLYKQYPNWTKLSTIQSLCLMQKNWMPLIESLCHRRNKYGLSNEQDNRAVAISYFMATYQHLLHTMMLIVDTK